ncbi:MAG: MFS transporter [Streptosporangiaceae bacterium]
MLPIRLAVILVVSILRGAGFAAVTVAGGALTASMIPPSRRGEGLAVTGVVSGVPALVSLPLGVWASARWGFSPVFIATAAAALLAVASVFRLPEPQTEADRAHGITWVRLCWRDVRRPGG